ncbi:MAG: TonB-dependent receptor, partial [Acidobacteria bacterium]|nr:TonB-dependent receptor [Acidobacteriota bacterium]
MSKEWITIVFLLVLALGMAWGQGAVGTLTGTVSDATGAVVPGAAVTATNTATGVETKTTTTSTGTYRLPYLPSGAYRITVTAPGFRTAAAENVILRVGQTQNVDVRMELGAVAEQVTVSAETPLLESSSAEIGRYVTTAEYKSWPILVSDGQRQIQQFIFSSLPGTTGNTFKGSINGGQQYSHEILVEGIPLGRSDLMGGNNNEFSPSAEAVSEFKLHTGAIGAQYNGGQTAIANFAIKSGTNDLHGSAFYYVQNESLKAFTLADKARGRTTKSLFRQHNYGYSVGGPVYIPKIYNGRNRTFFFTNFENTDRKDFNIAGLNNTLPVQDFRKGDFSRLLNPAFTGNSSSGSVIGADALGRPVRFGQIYDPATTRRVNGQVVRDPFPNNIVPQNRISPVAKNVIDNVGIVNPEIDTMIRNTPAVGTCCPFFDLYIAMVKGDHHISDNHRISGLYNHSYRKRNNNGGQRYLPIPGPATQSWQDQLTPGRLVRLSLDSTVTPRLLNRLAAGYNRFRNTNVTAFINQDWAGKIGIQNTSPTHFPVMTFGGTEWQGGTLARLGSGNRNENFNGSWIYQDDLTYIQGSHSFRFGYEYRRYFYNERNFPSSGSFSFSPTSSWMPGFTTQTGHSFASFLLGAVNNASRDVVTLFPGFRQSSHAFYVTDDWKITPRLTANLGLRWEIIRPLWEVTDRMSMIDLNVPNPAAGNLPGALVFRDRLQDTNWLQLGPRLGLAYRATDKLVVRAGYGITSTPPISNDWGYGGFTFGFNGDVPVQA